MNLPAGLNSIIIGNDHPKNLVNYTNCIVNLRKIDLQHMTDILARVSGYFTLHEYNVWVFRQLFGNNYWRYINTFHPNDTINFKVFIIGYDFTNFPEFTNQANEYEYLYKLFLLSITNKNINVDLPFHEMLLDYITEHENKFTIRHRIYHMFECNRLISTTFINFIYAYADKCPAEIDYIDELTYGHFKRNPDLSPEYLNNLIKNMTCDDIIECSANVYIHYYIHHMHNSKIAAMKSFISCLDKSCDLDDTDDIIISKTSVKALINEIGDYTEN